MPGDLLPQRPQGSVTCGEVERWARRQGFGLLVGLDEAGRGPLAGPVVAGAVVLPPQCPPCDALGLGDLNDSKALTARARDRLFDRILAGAITFGVAVVGPGRVDEVNILQASLEAMGLAWRRAVRRLPEAAGALALVDGKQRAHLPPGVEQRPLVKGDARSVNIAAASVLAKVVRDRIMVGYDRRWPVYGFARHKGYPTAAHRAAIAAHGPCPIHRLSFRLLPPEPAA